MKTRILILLAVAFLGITACDKEEELVVPTVNDLTVEETKAVAVEAAEVGGDLADVREFIGEGSENFTNGRTRPTRSPALTARHLKRRWETNADDSGFDKDDWNTCADVTIFYSPSNKTFSVTFDFGAEGCMQDSLLIKGKVTQIWSQIEGGYTHEVIFEDFFRKRKTIDGEYKQEVLWTGPAIDFGDSTKTDSTDWVNDDEPSEAYTLTANETFEFTVTRVNGKYKMVKGNQSFKLQREAFTIVSGKIEATNSAGKSYLMEVKESIISYSDCDAHVPQKGVLFVKENSSEVTIDFGDGECDDLVTLTGEIVVDWSEEWEN